MIYLSEYLRCTWRTKLATEVFLTGVTEAQGGTNPVVIGDVAEYPLGI